MKRWKPSKGYVCPCGVCAAKRATKAARPRQTTRKELESLLVSERNYSRYLFDRVNELAPKAKLGARVHELATRHLDTVWTSQDGRELRVQAMSDSHLFYALAKGRRGEYGTWSEGAFKVKALESEALRRLAGVHATDTTLEEALSWGR